MDFTWKCTCCKEETQGGKLTPLAMFFSGCKLIHFFQLIFSICSASTTLTVEARSKVEYDVWTEGLQDLIGNKEECSNLDHRGKKTPAALSLESACTTQYGQRISVLRAGSKREINEQNLKLISMEEEGEGSDLSDSSSGYVTLNIII